MKKLLVGLWIVFVSAVYAQTESINWYKDGQTYATTTCQTGSDINLPTTAPTKRGYNFTGWIPVYDFTNLDYTVAGTIVAASEQNKTWTIRFSYGDVSGVSLCSVTTGGEAAAGTPDESGGGDKRNCWCKATKYQPNGENIVYESILPTPWVFRYDLGSANSCSNYCVSHCTGFIRDRYYFRQALFGIH